MYGHMQSVRLVIACDWGCEHGQTSCPSSSERMTAARANRQEGGGDSRRDVTSQRANIQSPPRSMPTPEGKKQEK